MQRFLFMCRQGNARFPRWFFLLLAVVCNAVWAVSYSITKQLLETVSPLALTFWRLLIAAIFLLMFVRRNHLPKKLLPRDVWLLFLMGWGCLAGATMFQYAGAKLTSASNVAVLISLEIPVISVMAVVFLSEIFRWGQAVSLVVAVVGVLVITLAPGSTDLLSRSGMLGNGLVLVSVVAYAGYTIVAKKLVTNWHSLSLTAFTFALAVPLTAIVAEVIEPGALRASLSMTSQQIAAVMFLGLVSTAVSFLAWNWLTAALPAVVLAPTLFVQPVLGALVSHWWLGESFSTRYLMGAALVLGALAVGMKSDGVVQGLEAASAEPVDSRLPV